MKKKASTKRWRVDSGKCRGEEKNLVQIVADDRQAGYPCVRLGSEMGFTSREDRLLKYDPENCSCHVSYVIKMGFSELAKLDIFGHN